MPIVTSLKIAKDKVRWGTTTHVEQAWPALVWGYVEEPEDQLREAFAVALRGREQTHAAQGGEPAC